ncbi:glycosyltransferase family 2 protein [Echinicola sediminis]
MKRAAIVILNYNGKEMLEKFLPIVVQNSSFEVIIADNASSDGSEPFLKEHYPEVRTIFLAKNHGFSQGYNEALSQLEGEFAFYLLLNSDVEVTPGWDSILVQWLESHVAYAAVQPKVLSQTNKPFFDYAGAGGGYIDQLGFPYCRGRILDLLEKDEGQYDDDREVDWVSGACFAVRADLYHKFGGFEPLFFAHMEEIDLCWRLSLKGYRLGYTGKARVYHVGGGTLSRTSPFKTYLNYRNNLLMLYRNLKTTGFLKIMSVRIFMDLAAVFFFLVSGKSKHALQVLKAYRDFSKMKHQLRKSSPLALKLPSNNADKKVRSIVMTYYLKGKRKYSVI